MARFALHCIFLKWFKSYFKQFTNYHVEQCASDLSQLKEIIHYLSGRFSYQTDNNNIKTDHILDNTDMVSNVVHPLIISHWCVLPFTFLLFQKYIYIFFNIAGPLRCVTTTCSKCVKINVQSFCIVRTLKEIVYTDLKKY